MAEGDLTTIVSSKGQVILPKALRDALQWNSGTRLVVEQTPSGVLLRASSGAFATTTADAVFGCLAYSGEAMSIDDMDAGVAAETRRRHAGGRY